MGKQYLKEIKLREYGRTSTHPCTFLFTPQLTRQGISNGHHYAVGALNTMWASAIKRAGIRYRNAYQSRHTYACWMLSAGANPTFIASQMGHASAQMVYNVYGRWMPESSMEQINTLNQQFRDSAPLVPHSAKADS